MRVTMQHRGHSSRCATRWNVRQKKSQSTALHVQFQRPRMRVAISNDHAQRQPQLFESAERCWFADVAQMPDLIRAFQPIRQRGRTQIVGIGKNSDAHEAVGPAHCSRRGDVGNTSHRFSQRSSLPCQLIALALCRADAFPDVGGALAAQRLGICDAASATSTSPKRLSPHLTRLVASVRFCASPAVRATFRNAVGAVHRPAHHNVVARSAAGSALSLSRD